VEVGPLRLHVTFSHRMMTSRDPHNEGGGGGVIGDRHPRLARPIEVRSTIEYIARECKDRGKKVRNKKEIKVSGNQLSHLLLKLAS